MRKVRSRHVYRLINRHTITPAPQSISSLHLDDPILASRLSSIPVVMPTVDTSAVPLRLALSLAAPPLSTNVASNTNTNAPGALVASGTPCPACSTCDGQVVPTEREPCCCNADQTAEEQVEAEMPEVCKTCACHVDGRSDRCENEGKRVYRRCSRLVANGDHCIVLSISGIGERRLLLVDWKDRSVGRDMGLEVGRCDGRGVRRVCREGTRSEERDGDGELGGQEQRQVEKTCPGDWQVLASENIMGKSVQRTTGMATRKGLEPVFHDVLIGICADGVGD
mgnify:CR=1 FL=1